MRSHYDVLGVTAHANTEEIKQAYKDKLFAAHPDKSQTPANTGQVSLIKLAYAILRDPKTRQDYDAEFHRSLAKQGFDSLGDGLDQYSLADFVDDGELWHLDCPRCLVSQGISLDEQALEEFGTPDGQGGLMLIVQCGSCSLWIKVTYEEVSE